MYKIEKKEREENRRFLQRLSTKATHNTEHVHVHVPCLSGERCPLHCITLKIWPVQLSCLSGSVGRACICTACICVEHVYVEHVYVEHVYVHVYVEHVYMHTHYKSMCNGKVKTYMHTCTCTVNVSQQGNGRPSHTHRIVLSPEEAATLTYMNMKSHVYSTPARRGRRKAEERRSP